MIGLVNVLPWDGQELRELFRRFGSRQLAEDHAALEFAINIKRGAVELTLGRCN